MPGVGKYLIFNWNCRLSWDGKT